MLKNILKNKILLIILVIVIIIGGYIGLSNKDSGNNTITIAIMGEPFGLDPNLEQEGAWEFIVLRDLYTGLFEISIDGKMVPAVAKNYEISKDGLVYTFHLIDSKWSDGVPVTANDFEYSYKRILDPKVVSYGAYHLFDIKNAQKAKEGKIGLDQVGIKVVDDYTLQITLENPVGYFIKSLNSEVFSPIPKHKVEQYGDNWSKPENIATNGAYKPVEWVPKSYIKAVKNDQYYDANSVKIDEVIYYTQEDRAAVLKRFRAGEIDIAYDFSYDQYDWLKEHLPKETKVNPSNGIVYIAVNVNHGVLKDIKVRKALALAIDREFIVDRVLKTGEQASYTVVPYGLDYDPVKIYFSDWTKDQKIAEAKKLLKEAGYTKNNPLKVELAYTTDENDKKTFVAIASMWKDIGVQVETNTREVLLHYQALQKNKFDAGRARWLGSLEDPATYLELFVANTGNNYGLYNNQKYNDIFAKAKTISNINKRNQLYKEAETILLDEIGVIPIYYYVSKNLVNQRVNGWVDNSSNKHLVKYMSLK